MLRLAVLVAGFVMLTAAVLLWPRYGATGAAFPLLVWGLLIVGGILLERRGYRPAVDRTRGGWQMTEERFVDPTTGRTMQVRYNPKTGQRDYIEAPGPAQNQPPV